MAYQVVIDRKRAKARRVAAFAGSVSQPTGPSVPVKVVANTTSATTFLQKFKGWWNQAIVITGALATLLTQLGPFVNLIPASERPYYTGALAVVTAVSALLVKNQQWVDDL